MQLNNSRPFDSLDWLADTAARGESIIACIIRERNEARAAAKARKARAIRIAFTLGLPVALLAGIGLGELTAYALGL